MKSKIGRKLIIGLIGAIFAFSFYGIASAQTTGGGTYDFNNQSGLEITADGAGYTQEIKEVTIEERVSRIINTVLLILGVLFLVLIMYAGITWMTAFGNEEKVGRAVQILTEAIVGLFVVFAAYALSWFILEYFWQ